VCFGWFRGLDMQNATRRPKAAASTSGKRVGGMDLGRELSPWKFRAAQRRGHGSSWLPRSSGNSADAGEEDRWPQRASEKQSSLNGRKAS